MYNKQIDGINLVISKSHTIHLKIQKTITRVYTFSNHMRGVTEIMYRSYQKLGLSIPPVGNNNLHTKLARYGKQIILF